MKNEDIAAISTPPGEGGIAIIRLSGSEVIKKVNKIFQPCHTPRSLLDRDSHTLTLGYLKDDQNEVIDQVLVSIMKGPRSYTGEDVVEINTHGGNVAVKRCLEAVLQQGIRLAEPGEFTKRAFLNGRMDLSQAEAVVEVIRAKTARGLKLAINQLSGRNSQACKIWLYERGKVMGSFDSIFIFNLMFFLLLLSIIVNSMIY
jgi:tRNA modification GTPase